MIHDDNDDDDDDDDDDYDPLLSPHWGNSYCRLKRNAKVSLQGFERLTFQSKGRHSTTLLYVCVWQAKGNKPC
jgi:hypothetical protein